MNNVLPKQLRESFWEEDRKAGGIIHSQYEEVKQVLHNKNMDWVLQKYELVL